MKLVYFLFLCFSLIFVVMAQEIGELESAELDDDDDFSIVEELNESNNKKYTRRIRSNAFVTIEEGILQGIYKKSHYSFKGIRYGQAPTGQNRFKPAQPELPWNNIRKVHTFEKFCPQLGIMRNKGKSSEDCLFLNVFTPSLPDDNNFDTSMPVMFWIHGGFYRFGSGNYPLTGPEYLLGEKIVVVTSNYRLGPLGFLCINEDAPGNAGIHDQILALKWVQRNIKAFGGDPDKVTIFGFSTGAVMAELLTLSPVAEGLFKSAILQSGSVLNANVILSEHKENAFRLAKELGFETTSEKELIEFLRKVPENSMIDKVKNIQTPARERNVLNIHFSPCIDVNYTAEGQPPVLPEDPLEIIKSGKYKRVPIIAGHTDEEALHLFKNPEFKNSLYSKYNSTNLYFVPANLNLENLSEEEITSLANNISVKFLGLNRNLSKDEMLNSLVPYGNSALVVHGIARSLRLRAQNSDENLFSYEFAYDGNLNIVKRIFRIDGVGVGHAGDLGYIFSASRYIYNKARSEPNSNDITVLNRMVKMWANFAKYGHPTPKENWENLPSWKPIISSNNYTYMLITESLEQKYGLPFPDHIKFWDDIYESYE